MKDDWADKNNGSNNCGDNRGNSRGNSKRVILITGDGSKWYEQAIFIVRKDCLQKEMPGDFIVEAERIVNNYMSNINIKGATVPLASNGVGVKTRTKTKRRTVTGGNVNLTLNLLMFICCAVLLALFCSAYFF